MDDKRPTRRDALTAAAALPAFGQEPVHPVVHFEIGCRDREKTQQFFSALFGWRMQAAGAAAMIDAAAGGIAGHITALGHEPSHYVTF